MTYTARQLITKAYYRSGIVAREFKTVSGQELSDGLDMLNDLLAISQVDSQLIPYMRYYNFSTVEGQEKYYIPYLIQAFVALFNLDGLRFAITFPTRDVYFGSSRVESLETLPVRARIERSLNGSDMYFYPLPNKVYPIKIWGKFGLTETTFDADLLLSYERSYLTYLKNKLARVICIEFDKVPSPELMREIVIYEEKVRLITVQDMSIKTVRTIGSGDNVADKWFAMILGGGWM